MQATSSVVLLWLLLMAWSAAAQGNLTPGSVTRRIELGPNSSGEAVAVAVSPGLSTVFLFDSELEQAAVDVDTPMGFSIVDVGRMTLRVVPSAKIASGEKVRVSVRFRDGAAPPGASFLLTVHPAHADSLVEVFRSARTVESYQQEARDARAETLRCQEENSRLVSEHRTPGGLAGLLAVSGIDGTGVAGRIVTETVSSDPKSALKPFIVRSYRSKDRVALEVLLRDLRGEQPWTASGAALRGPHGLELKVLRVWQEAPIVSGGTGRVVIEAEATAESARGGFSLKLWEYDGPRTATIGNVAFP
ncbi:DUF2381 family protein [Myxococcus sp. AB056]|uniref:DUF2381 family protein n=1 Tax=Myxococcus sp. AB056 TaxID=2562792 RepID=UPI0011464C7E|nr:DUF2381 family protein [Myxococcus sp. AB056]